MNKQELYDYIVSQLTPEEALMRLLESSLLQYEHLKFPEKGKEVAPEFIIAMAALDLGWIIAVEKNQKFIRGIAVGTKEYMDEIIKKEQK